MKNVSSISKDSKYESCQKKHTEKKKNLHIKKKWKKQTKTRIWNEINAYCVLFFFSTCGTSAKRTSKLTTSVPWHSSSGAICNKQFDSNLLFNKIFSFTISLQINLFLKIYISKFESSQNIVEKSKINFNIMKNNNQNQWM